MFFLFILIISDVIPYNEDLNIEEENNNCNSEILMYQLATLGLENTNDLIQLIFTPLAPNKRNFGRNILNFNDFLIKASEKGFIEIFKFINKEIPELNITNYKLNTKERSNLYNTPLYYAMNNKKKELIIYLIKNGADLNIRLSPHEDNYLHVALKNGLIDIFKLLLNNENINIKSSFKLKNENLNITALHYVSAIGQLKLVKFLIEKGAEIDSVSSYNSHSQRSGHIYQTPLQLASRFGHLEIVKYLIDKGAYVDWKNSGSAYKLATGNGKIKVAKYLQSIGCDTH